MTGDSMTKSDMPTHLPAFISKMKAAGLQPVVTDTFAYYYNKVISGETGFIYDNDIRRVAADEFCSSDALGAYTKTGKQALPYTVRITLNGGLGTSMGLTTAKSLLEVRNGKSFLDIIAEQSRIAGVRLALMNSFNTHEDTSAALANMNASPLTFLQHKFPKILQDDFAPAICFQNPDLEWNPPGHGDIYTALLTSGMILKLLNEGIRYAFISNSDNLGASLDLSLLGYFAEEKFPFMMEVAERTPADCKGGHLARHISGRLILRESAQCPECETDAFRDIRRFGFFNTNNLWINLKFLEELIESQKTVRLPIIVNPKTLDPRDENSPKVFQIETAMGAAVSLFEGATAVKVPRTRFFPVKKCNDLLLVRSDYFLFTQDGQLQLNPDRRSDRVIISLDPKYYGRIDHFDARFGHIPSLAECESLTVKGDVRFESNVKIKGNVSIRNTGCTQAVVKEGTVIEHDLVF